MLGSGHPKAKKIVVLSAKYLIGLPDAQLIGIIAFWGSKRKSDIH